MVATYVRDRGKVDKYSKTASNKKQGFTLLELELFVRTAKQAGISPGACITGEVTMRGKQKILTATNDHSPQRQQIYS
jgi:hypothetical protein